MKATSCNRPLRSIVRHACHSECSVMQAWDREVGARDLGVSMALGDGGEVADKDDLGCLYIKRVNAKLGLPF